MKKVLSLIVAIAVCFCFLPLTDAADFAADAASKIMPPTEVSIEWDESRSEPSKLNVFYNNPNDFDSMPEYNNVYAQIDWRLTGEGVTDSWKYSSAWDRREKAVPGSEWEFERKSVPSYGGKTDVGLFRFDTDYTHDSKWLNSNYPNEGWGAKVPEIAITKITRWKDKDECYSIDWNHYGVEVRVRYLLEIYDENAENDSDRYKYEWTDWSNVVSYGNFAKDYVGIDNLLVNPDFEEGLTGWTNPDGVWSVVESEGGHDPQHGRFFAWGYKSASLDKNDTYIYQDVDLSAYQADETVIFNTLLCNYDQAPHDMGKIKLVFYDKDGKAIETYTQSQRNPNWNTQSIVASIPENTVKARVYLMAHRYVGADIDAYYDYCSFVVKPYKVYPVTVTEKNNKDKVKQGDILTLTADNSKTKDPSAYTWSSSYNTAATVDAKGKVTMHTNAEDGVAIYARDNETGVTGVYWINSDEKNAVADFDIKEFCKGLSLKFNGMKTSSGKTAFYFGEQGTANLKKIEDNGYTLEFVYYKAESKKKTDSPKCTIYMSKSSKKSSKNGYQMIPTKGTHNYYYYYVCQINVKDKFKNTVATISKDQVKFGWARWTGSTVK